MTSDQRVTRDAAGPIRSDDAEMFDLAPVALWLEDFSDVKALFEEWRQAGVTSLPDYLRDDPSRAKQCAERIRLIKVNRRTLPDDHSAHHHLLPEPAYLHPGRRDQRCEGIVI